MFKAIGAILDAVEESALAVKDGAAAVHEVTTIAKDEAAGLRQEMEMEREERHKAWAAKLKKA